MWVSRRHAMRLRTLTACAAGLLAVMLGGCRDWLTEVPEDFFSQDNFPASEADLKIALGGIDDWYTGGQSQAYFLIARIPQMTSVSQDVKDRYLGATKFHRAFNHFNAVRVWGSVPLMLTPVTDFSSVGQATRAPIADVYAAIVADLQDAADR